MITLTPTEEQKKKALAESADMGAIRNNTAYS